MYTLIDKITDLTATVGIVGLGYVGLPWLWSSPRPGFGSAVSTSTRHASTVLSAADVSDETVQSFEGYLTATTTSCQVLIRR